jgi:hypothetical protein
MNLFLFFFAGQRKPQALVNDKRIERLKWGQKAARFATANRKRDK